MIQPPIIQLNVSAASASTLFGIMAAVFGLIFSVYGLVLTFRGNSLVDEIRKAIADLNNGALQQILKQHEMLVVKTLGDSRNNETTMDEDETDSEAVNGDHT